MAITNTLTPTPFTFSGNFIPLEFSSDNIIATAGVKSVNRLTITGTAGTGTLTIKYGARSLVFTFTATPDDSGLQLPTGDIATVYNAIKSNYYLSLDYDITQTTSDIVFTAREAAYGLDWSATSTASGVSFTQVTPGKSQVKRDNFAVFFELWCETDNHSTFEKIYTASLPITTSRVNVAEVDIADKLNDYMLLSIDSAPEIPDQTGVSVLSCKKTCRKYFYRYAESFGNPVTVTSVKQSQTYTALAGGLSYVASNEKTIAGILQPDAADPTQDRFLKQSQGTAIAVKTRPSAPQFLYFFNTRNAVTGAKLKVKWYYREGGSLVEDLAALNLGQFEKVAFNLRYDKIFSGSTHGGKSAEKYEVWLENSTAVRISEIQTYLVAIDFKKFVRYFLFLSSWGAVDTKIITGRGSSEYKIEKQEAQRFRTSGSKITAGDSVYFDVKATDQFKVNSGWLSNDELILFRDFVISGYKYRFYKGRLLPIGLTSDSIAEKTDADTLFKMTFDYKYLYADDAMTERSDSDVEPPDSSVPVLGRIYFGPVSGLPVTDQVIKSLQSQAENVFDGTLSTGQNRAFVIAMPVTKKLASVTDLQSEENITAAYVLSSTLLINELAYKVYIMQNLVAYISGHDHQFTVQFDATVPLPPPVGQAMKMYFGPATVMPNNQADLEALGGSQLDSITTGTLDTGTGKLFVIAISAQNTLQYVEDLTNKEDVSGAYRFIKNILIGATQYKVYALSNIVPYSISHTHKFSIQNG